MKEPLYRLVTPEQFEKGWIEMRGVTPIHHDFLMIRRTEHGDYVVKEPTIKAPRATSEPPHER